MTQPIVVAPKQPPALIYLPPLFFSEKSSGPRIAEMMALNASRGPGAFEVVVLPTADTPKLLVDGRRLVGMAGDPVLDVFTYDYLPRLSLTDKRDGNGLAASLWRFVRDLQYMVRSIILLLGARRRSKSLIAKMQLILGFSVALLMAITLVFTGIAVLNAVGLTVTLPAVPEGLQDAVAIGLASIATWLLVRVRPLANEASNFVAQLLEYTQDERHAASVYGGLASVIDSLVEKDPDREVHIFGYSFGAVVAVDFLYPRASLHDTADRRIARAVRTLSTVGCPLDLVRLYMPDYLNGRQNMLPELVWRNVFIAADVMSSNFHDSDDSEEEPPDGLRFAGENRTSCRYTDHRLTVFNIFLRRGFISHRNYWGEPDEANCLHLVMNNVGVTPGETDRPTQASQHRRPSKPRSPRRSKVESNSKVSARGA